MSTVSYATIKGDPNKLLDFMKKNVVLSGGANKIASPGITNIEINKDVAMTGTSQWSAFETVKEKDQSRGLYRLKAKGTDETNSLKSFVCNYTDNKVESVDLTSAANFCFTATMNGCTFGIGEDKKGVRKVSHANCKKHKTKTSDAYKQKNVSAKNSEEQVKMIKEEHGIPFENLHGVSLLERAMYRINGEDTAATTFGIRVGGDWKFYAQVYKVHFAPKRKYELLTVISIPNPEDKTDKLDVPDLSEENTPKVKDQMPPQQATENSIDIGGMNRHNGGKSNRMISNLKEDIDNDQRIIENLEDQIEDLQLELKNREQIVARKQQKLRNQRSQAVVPKKTKRITARTVSTPEQIFWT